MAALVVFFLAWAAPRSASDEQDGVPSTETLQGLVRQLIALDLEAEREQTRWEEEKAHLESMLALLSQEEAALEEESTSLQAEADSVDAERNQLETEISAAEAASAAVDRAVREQGPRVLAVFEALAKPLREPLEGSASRVRAALAGDESGAARLRRLRLVVAFAADLDRVLSSVHALKEVLPLEGAQPREVDVLYLGGTIGYFVGPGNVHAGLVFRADRGEWKVVVRDELAPVVRQAIAVFRKEDPALLVHLPMPAGRDA